MPLTPSIARRVPHLRHVALVALSVLLLGCAADSAAASAASVGVSPATLSGTAPVRGTVGIPAAAATGGTSQEITQSFDPGFLRLDGTARVAAPQGWTVTYSSDGTTFGAAPVSSSAWAQVRAVRATGTAAGTAATGGTMSQSVAALPSGAFSGGGGGDGWNVFFDAHGHVFSVFHHNGVGGYPNTGIGAIDCRTRTGGSCGPGWPFFMSANGTDTGPAGRVLNTGVHSAGWVDASTGHLWFPTNDNGTNTGVACLDVADPTTGPAWCGGSYTSAFKILGAAGPQSYSTDSLCRTGNYPWGCVDGLAVAGSRLYTTETRTGKVLCLDMAANGGAGAACAGQPYVLAGANAAPSLWNGSTGYAGGWVPALINVDGRILGTALGAYASAAASVASPVLFCLDGSTGAACPGWTAPKALPSGSWLTYAEPSATGTINGVCVRAVTASAAGGPTCFSLAGASIAGNTAIGAAFRQTTTSENMSGSAITVGTRVLWGDGNYTVAGTNRVYCANAATNADCTGWPATQNNYVVVVDPANADCFWTNSDSQGIRQLNIGGTTGCVGTAPPSATFTAANLVATQRVNCTEQPTWGGLSLTSPAQGTYATAALTVLDADGAVVTSGGTTWQNVPLAADGTMDLSTLMQADTGSNPQFIVGLAGRTNGLPVAATITAPSYEPQLCTTLTPQERPCPHTTAPTGSLLGWTSPIVGEGTQGGTAVASAEASVTFASAATAACAPAPPTPPPPAPRVPPSTPRTSVPAPPTVVQPRVSPAGTAVITTVAVAAPGVVQQRGVTSGGSAACASRPIAVRRRGTVAVTCWLEPAAIVRMGKGTIRIRLVTTLRTRGHGTVRSVRVVTVHWHPEPVTG